MSASSPQPQREPLLQALCDPAAQAGMVALLQISSVRIAVPCSTLSKAAAAGGVGSKVVVTICGAKGAELKLDCGRWWRGAPVQPVYMHYTKLLAHANDDTLTQLHKKLAAIANWEPPSSALRSSTRQSYFPSRQLASAQAGTPAGGQHSPKVDSTARGQLVLPLRTASLSDDALAVPTPDDSAVSDGCARSRRISFETFAASNSPVSSAGSLAGQELGSSLSLEAELEGMGSGFMGSSAQQPLSRTMQQLSIETAASPAASSGSGCQVSRQLSFPGVKTDGAAARAAQPAVDQPLTSDELQEVPESTNRMFIAPWAVAPAQPAHTVRCFSEAGVQTGACCLPTLAPGVDDSAGHFQAALSHLGAALPHMAMGLADVHLWLGNEDPRFSTLQYYFNTLLQLRDEITVTSEKVLSGDA